MSKKNSLFRVLVYFVLFPFLLAALPKYDEREDLDPGVSLDLSATPIGSAGSPTIHKDRSSISLSSKFCSKTHPMRSHQSWNTYPQPFTSELISSVTLRC